jgi:hypothetical protein
MGYSRMTMPSAEMALPQDDLSFMIQKSTHPTLFHPSLLPVMEIVFEKSHQKLLVLFNRQRCNASLKRFVFGLWGT